MEMDTFSPELSGLWLREPEQSAERPRLDHAIDREALSPAQQVALEELAERVSAARSVV